MNIEQKNQPTATLANINVFVRDLPRARAFYESAFGLTVDDAHSAPLMVAFPMKTCTLSLQDAASIGKVVNLTADGRNTSGVELGFEVEDVEKAYERLKEAGAILLGTPIQQSFGTTFDALDPDGHTLTVYHMGGWERH